MKHWAGYKRVRYLGRESNRLELEFKCIGWNLKRLVKVVAASSGVLKRAENVPPPATMQPKQRVYGLKKRAYWPE